LERFDDLVILVRELSDEADVWINTSGFGLTEERAKALKNAGLTGAEISLDHWSEEGHNLFRGNNKSFYWAREAALNCRNSGILTCLSLCATDSFVTEENLVKYVSQVTEWGISFIRLLEPRKTTFYDGGQDLLSPAKTKILEDFFIRSHSDHTPQQYPVVSYPYYHQRRIGCLGAGDHYLYIDPRGDVHACPFCRLPAGNALTDSIEDVVIVLKKRGCQMFFTHASERMII
jgi:MoaA/NifB/PqqE/SkfB family radical SAM enzyme